MKGTLTMSEIKLNLVDSQKILVGTIHGSVGDYCVAALSAEPETIRELEAALERFEKDPQDFHTLFRERSEIDKEPYDAGILVIDLAARMVAYESTYSLPSAVGEVEYHNGKHATDVILRYCLPDDWEFVDEIDHYRFASPERRRKRLSITPLNTREVLYGPPLLEFLATNIRLLDFKDLAIESDPLPNAERNSILSPISEIHAQWLLTPRDDLRGQSPRDVLLAKQDFISCDLQFRSWQWSSMLEGPPCISRDSFAYRFGGFGIHEWVLYYDLLRHLLNSGFDLKDADELDLQALVSRLETLKNDWLNQPNEELEGRIPAIVIDNERRRLPEAMGGRSMVIDEDCPLCKMMGDACEAGREVCFWHLDTSKMDDHFAFSSFATEKEYLEARLQMEIRHREFDRRWIEREERIARGEAGGDDPFLGLDEYFPAPISEPEPPEA
jgi:hypothetical protein